MPNIIKEFLHEGGIYYHTFSTINDSVTLWDFNQQPLLHYDSSARPVDVRGFKDLKLLENGKIPGPRLGRFIMGPRTLSFECANGTIIPSDISVHAAEGLLDFEVIISKQWISNTFPLDKPLDDNPFNNIPENVILEFNKTLTIRSLGGPVKQYMDKKRAKKKRRGYDYP